jgi:hypothetical protein
MSDAGNCLAVHACMHAHAYMSVTDYCSTLFRSLSLPAADWMCAFLKSDFLISWTSFARQLDHVLVSCHFIGFIHPTYLAQIR